MIGDAIRAAYIAIKLNDSEFYKKMQRVNATTDEAIKKFQKMEDTLKDLGKYMFGAGAALSAFLGVGIKQAADLEQAIINLEKVAKEGTNIYRLIKVAESLAKTYGWAEEEILNVMAAYARMGKAEEEIIDLTKATILWSIAASDEQMNVAEATEYLTYIMSGFKLEAKEAIRVVDSLNNVANNLNTDTRKLARTLQEAAGVAKEWRVPLEELIGYATALHDAGYEAGEVGTFLSYMFSQLYEKDVAKKLKRIGIAVEDVNGEFRSANDILNDLAKMWDKLDDAQKHEIATAITVGGRVSMLYALFKNWGTVIEATNYALNSQGSAAREAERSLKALHAQWSKTMATWKIVFSKIGSVFIPPIKTILKLIQKLGELFLELPKPIQTLVSLMIGFFSTVLLVGGGILLLRASIIKIISTLLTLAGVEAKAVLATKGLRGVLLLFAREIKTFTLGAIIRLITALRTLSTAFIVASRSILAFSAALLTNPIALIIIGIASAIYLLYKAWTRNWLGIRDKTKAVIEALSGAINRFTRAFDRLKTAVSSALTVIKTIFSHTIGWIISKIDEFIEKIKQAWEFVTNSPIVKVAAFLTEKIGLIQPTIKPTVEKPEYDRKYYEEGSIILKMEVPKLVPEIEKPKLPKLVAPIRFILGKLPKLPRLMGYITYLPKIIQPELRDLTAKVKFEQPKPPEIITRIKLLLPSLPELRTTVKHELFAETLTNALKEVARTHRTTNIGKIEINISGVSDPKKAAEIAKRETIREIIRMLSYS